MPVYDIYIYIYIWYISDAAAPIQKVSERFTGLKFEALIKQIISSTLHLFFSSFFTHPNKLLFVKRLTLKSDCQSSHKFNSQLSILVMLW